MNAPPNSVAPSFVGGSHPFIPSSSPGNVPPPPTTPFPNAGPPTAGPPMAATPFMPSVATYTAPPSGSMPPPSMPPPSTAPAADQTNTSEVPPNQAMYAPVRNRKGMTAAQLYSINTVSMGIFYCWE